VCKWGRNKKEWQGGGGGPGTCVLALLVAKTTPKKKIKTPKQNHTHTKNTEQTNTGVVKKGSTWEVVSKNLLIPNLLLTHKKCRVEEGGKTWHQKPGGRKKKGNPK